MNSVVAVGVVILLALVVAFALIRKARRYQSCYIILRESLDKGWPGWPARPFKVQRIMTVCHTLVESDETNQRPPTELEFVFIPARQINSLITECTMNEQEVVFCSVCDGRFFICMFTEPTRRRKKQGEISQRHAIRTILPDLTAITSTKVIGVVDVRHHRR